MITVNEYQKECLKTLNMEKTDDFIFEREFVVSGGTVKGEMDYSRILEGLIGLNGEAGECIDIIKKNLFQGHALDTMHLAEELGDVAWYLAVSAWALGFDLEDILKMNINKLRKRYPNGFEALRSIERGENHDTEEA